MWIDTEGVLACLCLRDRNGFLGKTVPVEACKLVNVHPTLRTFRFTTQDSKGLERQSSSRVSQKSRPTWYFDMTWERHQGPKMTASCNQTKLKKSLHEVQEILSFGMTRDA